MVRRKAVAEDTAQNAEEIEGTTRRTRKRACKDAIEEVAVKKQPRRNVKNRSDKNEATEEEEVDTKMELKEEEEEKEEGCEKPSTSKRGRKKEEVKIKTEPKEEGEENGCEKPSTSKRGRKKEEVKIKTEPKEEGEENGCEKPSTSKRGRKKKTPAEDTTVDDQKPSTSRRAKSKEEIKVEPEEALAASGKTPGVDRVVVVKGRAAVDALCPIAKTSHVYEDGDDIYDCMLNQTNIEFNNNKYYLIQLLQSDTGNTYSVWMRWGRVGANGQNSLQPCGSDLEKAKTIFCNKFCNKTKNDWHERHSFEKVKGKYDLLEMDYSDGKDEPDSKAAKEEIKEKRKKLECKLEARVKMLIELICNITTMEETVIEMKYDARKAPLGKLTVDQIKAGYLALKKIDDLIQKGSYKSMELVNACNDFYTRIPHYFGMKVPPLIRTRGELQEKMSLLEALGDIQAALSVLDQPIDINVHPADQHYLSLKCDISPVDKESADFKVIEKYLKTNHGKTHSQYSLELLELFECKKESEYERFKDVGNSMLLWHGSRLSNWAGILSQGLRIAPPEAPSTGYMFGKGIYFADMSSKSANYCWATQRNDTGLLLLSEVSLGKTNDLLDADYNANKLPSGCHSVKGCGRFVPASKNFTKLSDGTVVPIGPATTSGVNNPSGYTLMYNEFIVYDPAQVRTRFLLKVKFHFK
ncbi:poly [ADP-ribose] polymerase 2-like isoform X2 [Penaeus japonicus]|uniref:poly [ADP-ribose] polymerase 2-like isoform X2 n=1 Tax=Penaeus japonicus TaxID=27405 RepID=UPI001C714F9E|nr:poly [ADP-ribose] polymerase 2-like isoform X2 [Penaeus japonicus]